MSQQIPIPIAIDGRMLAEGGTGVATYAQALKAALAQLGREPLIVADGSSKLLLAPAGAFERRVRWLDALWDRPRLLSRRGRELRGRDIFRLASVHFNRHRNILRLRTAGPPGVMHWTYPLPIVLEGWTNVYTVHDMIPLTDPALTPIDGSRHLKIMRAILKTGGRFMAVSEAARRDTAEALGGSADIGCCPTGLDVTGAGDPLPAGLEKGNYFLAVGSVEPRKNFARLARAYQGLEPGLPLVIAGPSGWKAEEIESELAGIPHVHRLAYPSRRQLMALLQGARGLLFPSLAEGFGLPIVEAMALGTPVLTSRGGATAEVAGGAALLVAPQSETSIATGIARLHADEALRRQLVSAGLKRAELFDKAAFAARLDIFYRALPAIPVG